MGNEVLLVYAWSRLRGGQHGVLVARCCAGDRCAWGYCAAAGACVAHVGTPVLVCSALCLSYVLGHGMGAGAHRGASAACAAAHGCACVVGLPRSAEAHNCSQLAALGLGPRVWVSPVLCCLSTTLIPEYKQRAGARRCACRPSGAARLRDTRPCMTLLTCSQGLCGAL